MGRLHSCMAALLLAVSCSRWGRGHSMQYASSSSCSEDRKQQHILLHRGLEDSVWDCMHPNLATAGLTS